MKIDPRQFTLDANERAVLRMALAKFAQDQQRVANRNAQRLSVRHSDRVTVEKDAAEHRAARAADLLAKLEDWT